MHPQITTSSNLYTRHYLNNDITAATSRSLMSELEIYRVPTKYKPRKNKAVKGNIPAYQHVMVQPIMYETCNNLN